MPATKFYFGTNDFSVNQNCANYIRKWQAQNPEGEIETIDASADNAEHIEEIIAKIQEATQTSPLFGDKNLIFARRINFLGASKEAKTNAGKSAQEKLLNLCQKKSLANDLLVSGTEIDKRTNFFKFLKQNKLLELFEEIDEKNRDWESAAIQQAIKIASKHGLVFAQNSQGHDPVSLFVNLVGVNTQMMHQEIDKIALYLGEEKVIKTRTIFDLVSRSHHAVIFSIGQSLAQRKPDITIQLINELISAGTTALQILHASIIPTVRSLLYAKILTELNGNKKFYNYDALKNFAKSLPKEDSAFLPLTKTGEFSLYPIWLNLNQAQKFTTAKLIKALENCLETNLKLVSSDIDNELLLVQLILLCL